MRNKAHAAGSTIPVTDAHATRTGAPPAAPPITMFCGERLFSPRV